MVWFVVCFRQRAWCRGRGGFGPTSGEAGGLDKPGSGRCVVMTRRVCSGALCCIVWVWCVSWLHVAQDACGVVRVCGYMVGHVCGVGGCIV